MNTMRALVPLLALLAAACFGQVSVEKAPAPPTPPMTPEQEAFMKAGAPGPYHKLMEPLVGRWKAEVKVWERPGAEPVVSTGTSSHTWIFGGRYLKMEYSGPYLGQSFIGLGFMGFDNVGKRYVNFWLDNMSTWVMYSTGTVSRDEKTFILNGSYRDPVSGNLRHQRDEMRVEGPDRLVSRSYEILPGAKEFLSMEIVYTRAK